VGGIYYASAAACNPERGGCTVFPQMLSCKVLGCFHPLCCVVIMRASCYPCLYMGGWGGTFTAERYSPHCFEHLVVSESWVFLAGCHVTHRPAFSGIGWFVYRLARLRGVQLTSFALAKALNMGCQTGRPCLLIKASACSGLAV
jgi:hypothetical protein